MERIKESANDFVRVRLTRIDNLDLNLFDFDYDLTMMIFFLDADEKVYARYGGRDARNADNRQSLDGLHYTMKSVLAMHQAEKKSFAPKAQEQSKYIRDVPNNRGRGCMHCHNVKETLNADLRRTGKWTRDDVWRFPLPENVGVELEVDRGNVVKTVKEKTPAAEAGLKSGDVLLRLGSVPIHSFGDAQFALDRAPKAGTIEAVWKRGDKEQTAKLSLTEGWRRGDISWRPSLQGLMASARLYGSDLSSDEKKALSLGPKQLAFKQGSPLSGAARLAGVQSGDVILGFDGKKLEMDVDGFLDYVRSNYFVGDKVTVNLLREGKRHDLTMTLAR